MTEPSLATPAQYDGGHMRAMAAELSAHGLTTHLTDARAGLDLTATLSPSGKREAEIIIDEDGYAELRYWNPPGTTPAEATATALRALSAVIGTVPASQPPVAVKTRYFRQSWAAWSLERCDTGRRGETGQPAQVTSVSVTVRRPSLIT